MIDVKHLDYFAGAVQVLTDINIKIKTEEVTVILGPNGAGKSSLLQCICGTKKYSNGNVHYNNKDIHRYSLKELSKKRAVLSQSNLVSFPFTVMEIVMMGRTPRLKKSETDYDFEIVSEVLFQVDAYHLKDRIFPTLSGGEQQRVQLARVLAQIWEVEEAYLFLDEPTSALDLKHQHQILELVCKLVKKKSLSVVCILHDLSLAMYYSDKSILMSDGKVYAMGKTKEILSLDNLQQVYQLPADIIKRFHITKAIKENRH